MKTKIKTGIAALLLLAVISCTKESVNKSSSSVSLQSSNNSDAVTSFTIGQHYHGGIIFYIDNTNKHGLIAATADQGTGISWNNNGKNKTTNATATNIGSGADNTAKIVAKQGSTGSYAALLCTNYVSGKYTDWYLPSKGELNLLFQEQNVIGGFSATNYWSSSEAGTGKAWDQEFGGGFKFKDNKSFTLNVRAISSF